MSPFTHPFTRTIAIRQGIHLMTPADLAKWVTEQVKGKEIESMAMNNEQIVLILRSYKESP